MTESSRTRRAPFRQDLTGLQFGKLTAKSFAFRRKRCDYWLCECACGAQRVVARAFLLKPGGARTCLCHRDKPRDERFWLKVNKLPGEGACWEWTGHISSSNGYGGFSDKNIRYWTHRLSWEMANGPIPEGMCVCHHCDNRKCVRPDHLFLGTMQDNAIDMVRKNRHGNTRLTVEIAQQVYDRYTQGKNTIPELAEMFHINTGSINDILSGKVWAHATGAPRICRRRGKSLLSRTVRVGDTRYICRAIGDFYDDPRMPEAHAVPGEPEHCEMILRAGEGCAFIRLSREQAASLCEQLQYYLEACPR